MPKKERKSPATKKLGAEEVKKPRSAYKMSISVNEQTTDLKGNDIYEMLQSFIAPDPIKTDTDIAVSKGKAEHYRTLGVFEARKTFNNSTSLQLLASDLMKNVG